MGPKSLQALRACSGAASGPITGQPPGAGTLWGCFHGNHAAHAPTAGEDRNFGAHLYGFDSLEGPNVTSVNMAAPGKPRPRVSAEGVLR